MIELIDVTKIYRSEDLDTYALNQVSLTISEGEYVTISGPSGCGKSTLLSVLGLLDRPSEGKYEFLGNDLTTLNRNERAKFRNTNIGFVFQSFNLIESLSVLDNVKLPLIYKNELSHQEIEKMSRALLEEVEMSHRINHYPSQLSGGQQQRVAIARSMVLNPKIILADEPTGNLDTASSKIVMDLLKGRNKKGVTICMVTHDINNTRDSSRTIHMSDGKNISE